MKKIFKTAAAVLLFFAGGCTPEPLYEADYPVYRQYKYWETSNDEWFEADGFRILAYRSSDGGRQTLRMTAHRKGLPSVADGYVDAIQKVAFNMMTAVCGSQAYTVLPSHAPSGGRVIDRYFYQNGDLSVGVVFSCRSAPPDGDVLRAEAQKWSLARRRWDKIDGVQAYVDVLPENNDGLRQMRIRLFGGDERLNARLARRIMLDACGGPAFTVLFNQASADIVENGRPPQIISDANVRVYGFVCKL
ncbi:MAG: hypothetical protein ACI4PW_01820 [Alphaproteobacteria bacterium]